MKTKTTFVLTASILLALLTPLEAAPLTIENALYTVTVDASAGQFTIGSKVSGRTFVTSGGLSANNGSGRIATTVDEHFGRGQCIEVTYPQDTLDSVMLYPGMPFVAFRSRLPKSVSGEILCKRALTLSATLDLGKKADDLRTLGTGGLLEPARNPGSYAFLAVVDPASRNGVVGAWLTQDRASGVVFSPVENGQVTIKPRLDYGRLIIRPNTDASTETFLLGYFDDARFGLEAYAQAMAKQYSVTIRAKQPGYCTWYMEKYGRACDEVHLAELSAYAAKNLGPWGFGFIQIDDGWQSGISKNGPRKNFTTHDPKGPYPHGMKSTAAMISKLNLTPGIWFMPFAGTWDDPFFKDHQDWFVKTLDGKPYDTAWGGTCLDMTRPDVRDYVASVVSRISHEWGYKVFKMDGFWTGSATKQIYVNNGYKEDGIGDAVFFNKDKPNIEVMRDGVKLVRKAAGPDVFLLGCCISQNMRSLSGSLGLIDAMRVGPDTGAGTIGYPHASRLWFLNGRVWWNDPDCVSVRASLSLNQARLNATFAAISDTLFYNSDWMPDFPADRLDTLRRCMPGHGLPARPVDVFEHANARIWHVPDTRGPVRRDVVALFNYEKDPTRVSYDTEAIGLPKAEAYVGFDFWANKFVPPFTKTLTAELPAHACRVLAIRPVSVDPQLISTSRHVTQGMVDVTNETWDASAQTLSAASRVVGHDPYELRIVVPYGETSWRVKQVTVSSEDRAAGVETAFSQSGARTRVTLTSPTSREVTWTARFEPAAIHATVPKSVTHAAARVEYHQITVTWEDQDADLYRVTTQDGQVFETPDRSFVDRQFTRGQVSIYRIEAIGFGGTSTPVVVKAMPMAQLVLPPAPPLPTVALSDLEPEFVTCGWGTTHLDKNIQGQPLSLAGQIYPRGIGTHAPSQINCNIPAGAMRFVARVGVDDGKRTSPETKLVFAVYGDVREMGEKPVLLAHSPELSLDTIQDWSFNFELNSRFRALQLVVDDCGSNKSDWADWVNVGFVVAKSQPGLAAGPFTPDDASLKQYECPEWFRDAKLGIWAVWGPESVPMQGDWYARHLYEEGSRHYKYHVEHYGHPSKFGFKDIIPLWKAEKWDPDRLITLYRKAGAKYFCMIAEHHDNFNCWNSQFQRWNSVNMGPKRDIAGDWQQAALKQGLRFGMTEHLAASWWFYSAAKGADKTGPLAGVPYDGNDPNYADLYWSGNTNPDFRYYSTNVPLAYKQNWFKRIKDMIDRYHPDLVYSDSPLPYPDEVGRQLLSHYYNDSLRRHDGKLDAVYNCKQASEGRWVQDLERGVMAGISPYPWQTDTCVGGWYYDEQILARHGYKSPATVIHMLCDIVSKNGNLLLNFPPRPDGTLDNDELEILDAMAAWISVNGEAIYGTRPWKVFGEGPSRSQKGGSFNEGGLRYTARDLRFTQSKDGKTLYAMALGWPDDDRLVVQSLALAAGPVSDVALLGHSGPLDWHQTDEGLVVTLPAQKPCDLAYALAISAGDLKPVPVVYDTTIKADGRGRFVLRAAKATIHGTTPRYESGGSKDQIGYWAEAEDFVSWDMKVTKPGTFAVEVTYSCAAPGSRFSIEVGDRKLLGRSESTGSWDHYRADGLGTLTIDNPGTLTLAVKPKNDPTWKVIGLKSVTLTPIGDD